MISFIVDDEDAAKEFVKNFSGSFKKCFFTEREEFWVLKKSYEETLKSLESDYEKRALEVSLSVEDFDDPFEEAKKISESIPEYSKFTEIQRKIEDSVKKVFEKDIKAEIKRDGAIKSISEIISSLSEDEVKEFIRWQEEFYETLVKCLQEIKRRGKEEFMKETRLRISYPAEGAEMFVNILGYTGYVVFIDPLSNYPEKFLELVKKHSESIIDDIDDFVYTFLSYFTVSYDAYDILEGKKMDIEDFIKKLEEKVQEERDFKDAKVRIYLEDSRELVNLLADRKYLKIKGRKVKLA